MNEMSFWEASFLWRDPLIAAALAALLCAFVGVYVVLRRSAFASAAVSQAAGLGVVVALLLPHLFDVHPSPLLVGMVAGTLSAGLFGLSRRGGRVGVESSIALAYVIAGAASLLLGTFLTHEYEAVHSILFGDAVSATTEELWALGATTALVAALHLAYVRQFLFVSFDPETAGAMGMPVRRLGVALYFSAGLAISVATRAVGALPVFALTVVPAAGGLLLSDRLGRVIAFALASAVGATLLGYYLSFIWSLPTGATIVATAALALIPGVIRRAVAG